ncbi:MAG: enoyl-CoA hydratase/isomerase family protein [Alphaproteobacteria bacterium]|nr:enoyl-CoA hydratase/isomerase family protein [Alphaproteobacteria bacterium]MCB9698345.1 enoyl-CoA hydratase/isomerase family protein [Alphaproteobacteria bacterium]
MKRIVIEGPGKNALGTDLMVRLREEVAAGGGEGLLFVGSGDAFSAGLDLKEVASLDLDGMDRFLRRLQDLLLELYLYPGPTVACVNGHAIAGGCLVALVCDHRVGARNPRARIGLNEVALGLRFPPVLLQIAAARVARVEEVVLGSKLHDPENALRLGLLDELADDAMAVERAEQVLKYLESLPREAYAAAKRDLRARHAVMDHEANRAFLEEVLPVWTSDELKGRILKMLQR